MSIKKIKSGRAISYAQHTIQLIKKAGNVDGCSFIKNTEGSFDLIITKYGINLLLELKSKSQFLPYTTIKFLSDVLASYSKEDFVRNSLKDETKD